MPRKASLDAPRTLHHVIIRGIEQKKIVSDDQDRQNFVSRMGTIAVETGTSVYAWALMTNHAHILLRSDPSGLPHYMPDFYPVMQFRITVATVETAIYFKIVTNRLSVKKTPISKNWFDISI